MTELKESTKESSKSQNVNDMITEINNDLGALTKKVHQDLKL